MGYLCFRPLCTGELALWDSRFGATQWICLRLVLPMITAFQYGELGPTATVANEISRTELSATYGRNVAKKLSRRSSSSFFWFSSSSVPASVSDWELIVAYISSTHIYFV